MILGFICSFALAASLGICAPPTTRVAGYVEGEYVRLGPIDVARIESVAVRRGERVAPGAVVAELQKDDAQNVVAESEARLVQVRAQLANLLSGKRPEEIAVIEANAASAQAQHREAERALERRQDLFRRGVSTQADLDQAQTARDVAAASVRQSAANLAVARLAAREEEIRAAQNQVAQAQAALDQAKWRLSQRRLTAPAAGIVTDIVRHPGELAGPTAPVLTMLPDGAVKLMLYVPEALLSGTMVGTRLEVHCNGCPPGLAATVSYVSQEPEFTPPVIYSADTRQKLVYLVEARPEGGPAAKLQPGQIVDVVMQPAMSIENAIAVRGLTKRFGTRTVVDNVDLTVRQGEIVGFLGPNGSGKTTTIRLICGLLTPDAGEGAVLGFDVRSQSAQIKLNVGYMTQRFSFYEDLTIEENLAFVARLYGLKPVGEAVARTLDGLGLTSRKDQLAGTLSGGWKQRLALAACIMHEPKLLLLDEPTAGVDPKARREFWDEIHRLAGEGMTVLVSTHYMDEAERCHRIGYIAYGRMLATGTVEEVVQGSGLSTYVVHGALRPSDISELSRAEGVEQVAPFGATLHVVGSDRSKLEAALASLAGRPGLRVEPGETSLEDVFIQFMAKAQAGGKAA